MSGQLERFQDAFADALVADVDPHDPFSAITRQPGFAVYRNTVMKGCIDALQANYPATARVVGDEWFRAAAAVYVRASLPRDARLVDYGAEFASFLDRFEPAREIVYLADVARVDRLWTEVHTARDETRLDPAQVAALSPAALEHAVLRPHPAARWSWFGEQPIGTLWQRNRFDPDTAGDPLDWRGEGVLLTRPQGALGSVETVVLVRGTCALLDACAAGASIAVAIEAAVDATVDANETIHLTTTMALLLRAGAFARIDSATRPGSASFKPNGEFS